MYRWKFWKNGFFSLILGGALLGAAVFARGADGPSSVSASQQRAMLQTALTSGSDIVPSAARAFHYAATDSYVKEQPYRGYLPGYCTYYAAMQFDLIAPPPGINWLGDAYTWSDLADEDGWVVVRNVHGYDSVRDKTWDVTGSIVCWVGSLGHVAMVREVDANGILVQEMNWVAFNEVTYAYLTWPEVEKRYIYTFAGYILPVRK